jgi:prepilin-type N-terminal cleavage/methylation domain-containing protein
VNRQRGFTLIEVLVVMGILSVLGLFLIQILDNSVTLVGLGEGNRALLDRTSFAQELVGADLRRMSGPGAGVQIEAGQPSRRLLQDHVPLGLSPAARVDLVPRLRAHVMLERSEEERLVRELLRPRAEQEGQNATEREDLLDKWVAQQTFNGTGELVLVPWPEGDREGAYLQLRRAVRLSGRRLRITTALGGSDVAVGSVFETGALDEPADLLAATTPVLTGLLHLELSWWSQFTLDSQGEPGRGGPETCWDTARAGLLAREVGGHRFTLDLGPNAFLQPLIHVFPRRVVVRMVIDRPADEARCALLVSALEEGTTELQVDFPERLPYPDGERFVKIGGEWIRYSGIDGDRLTGIRRGVRGTLPRAHAAGVRIHAGREVVLVVPLVGRDCWNG